MADVAARVALVASAVLHAAVLIGVTNPLRWPRSEAAVLPDFWAGKTFEVPAELPDEPSAEGSEPAAIPIEVTGDLEPRAAMTAPQDTLAATEPGNTAMRPSSYVRAAARPAAARPAGEEAARPASAGGNPGPYGAEVSTAGLRDLPSSFVRALAPAISAEQEWTSLPLGSAGHVDLMLAIDDEGRVRLATPVSPSLPAPLRRLVQRTMILLAAGRFALSPGSVASGTETLRMGVHLSQVAAPPEQAQTGGVFGLGFEAPTAHQPGRAYATLSGGRRVEVTIQLLHARH
jgi:hypothetical protein